MPTSVRHLRLLWVSRTVALLSWPAHRIWWSPLAKSLTILPFHSRQSICLSL
ncbi:unnamed protein product [Penicillium salamii]|uniref:Uncharacterized protein n=1 Tax=Penicillium salamii TaxID=1612424 RepID=A0A9W4IWU3_9EURO|nr:unnamed protein product [Penicillium salamii]CAG8012795.1 unnamed protein product [Penicillium salamii]CAG8020068.1 unnamed protein product [Penicillium salamii]CAG8062506.1 unnamed protein product [Penicillium salamii]CAG8357168.1 unnamed protein product [Penicillium salamii]